MPRLEKLDQNFAASKVEAGTRWIDIRTFPIEGRAFADTESFYDRLPARAKPLVPEPVWELSHHSAGMAVRFVTNAITLNARWTLRNSELAMNHMPATGVSGLDFYTRLPDNSWRWLGVGRPTGLTSEFPLTGELDPGTREFMLYLPLYNGVTQVSIGIPESAHIERAPTWPTNKKPLCFYGTSIVQGGCASRPGMAYTAIVSRRLDRPHYNFGFSGNGRCEPAIAQLLAELDVSAYILDPLPNMSHEQVTERIAPFVKILRDKHPATPIVVIENIPYRNAFATPERRTRAAQSNAALQEVFADLQREKIPRLHHIPGDNLLGDDGEGTVDGVHPTDLGFQRIADAITPDIQSALA